MDAGSSAPPASTAIVMGRPAAIKARRPYAQASVTAVPGARCTLHPEGNTDPAQSLSVVTDYDGIARFSAIRAQPTDTVQHLTLDCPSATGNTSFVVDLQSDATFAAPKLDLEKVPGTDRPALTGDPASYSLVDLVRQGYGPRPDRKLAPEAYAHWLASASRPARRIGIEQSPVPAAATRPATTEHADVTGTEHTGGSLWTGAQIAGAAPYIYTWGSFTIPRSIEGGDGTTASNVTIWTGLGTHPGLIQGGVIIETTTTALQVASFYEYCCGDAPVLPTTQLKFNPGDEIYVQEWYGDAYGNQNENPSTGGGYGCSIVEDETTGATLDCSLASSTVCASVPPLNSPEWIMGNSAEWIMENESPPQWPDFASELSMQGTATTTTGAEYTISTASSVLIDTDSTANETVDHMSVSVSAPNTVNWLSRLRHVVADYNGDGSTDRTVWRPSNSNWYTSFNATTSSTQQTSFGIAGDAPLTGDFDGDGKSDLAVWRSSDASWYIRSSKTGSTETVQWGLNGDIPVPSDYDGDGVTDVAVWRPSNGTWYVINSSNGGRWAVQTGLAGDVPVTGDYDGDGLADLAVWRPSNDTWYVTHSSGAPQTQVSWGLAGDIPVPGDYDGDGLTDLAIWRPSNGSWWVIHSSNGAQVGNQLGLDGDVPSPGDYDGDGKTDLAVWRPSNGTWYVLYSSSSSVEQSTQWGLNGDIPLPPSNP